MILTCSQPQAMLQKDDPSRQMVYYQPGIGTSTTAGLGFRALAKAGDLMFGWSLDKHVQGSFPEGPLVVNGILTDSFRWLRVLDAELSVKIVLR
jgi:hypothetical protein